MSQSDSGQKRSPSYREMTAVVKECKAIVKRRLSQYPPIMREEPDSDKTPKEGIKRK